MFTGNFTARNTFACPNTINSVIARTLGGTVRSHTAVKKLERTQSLQPKSPHVRDMHGKNHAITDILKVEVMTVTLW